MWKEKVMWQINFLTKTQLDVAGLPAISQWCFLFFHNKKGIIIMLYFFLHFQLGIWPPRIKMIFPSPILSWEQSWDAILANGILLGPILLNRCRLGDWSARSHPGPGHDHRDQSGAEKTRRGFGSLHWGAPELCLPSSTWTSEKTTCVLLKPLKF